MPYYATIAAAQADGVVHYWIMHEQSGDAVADIISGWDGKIVGVDDIPSGTVIDSTVVSTPSGVGRDLGARYTGTERDILPIELPSPAPSLTPLPEITVRIRFFLTSEVFGSFSGWSPFGIGYGNPGGAVVTQYVEPFGLDYEIGTRNESPSGNPFTVGQWHDLVIAAGSASPGPGVKLFLNGSEIYSSTSGSGSFDIYQYAGEAIRGCIGGRNIFSGGSLDYSALADIIVEDLAIWNRALTLTDVQNIYAAGQSEDLTPPPPTDVSFDVYATLEPQFVVYTPGASGFVADAPLSASFEMYQDWTAVLNSLVLQEAYEMVITGAPDGLADLVVPISNWQATNQTGGRSAYLQAVIPGGKEHIDAISARENGELVIRTGFRLPSGESQFSEILRSDFDALRYDRSGNRFTVTVSGRRKNDTPASGARTLTGIRTISVSEGKRRVRCDVDMFLRPGMTVIADTEEFTADYINYFVSTSDKFCEVSER